jgi:phosphate transport system substrate-binding protein
MNINFFNKKSLTFLLFLSLSMPFVSCNENTNTNGEKNSSKNPAVSNALTSDNVILGAGSTTVYPLFSKQFAVYDKANNVQVNYQSIGSGGGILQLTNKTIDFGDSDVPLNDEQSKKIGFEILHIPMCARAIVMAYNLPEVKRTIKLDADLLSEIFLGKINKWDDPQIAKINPGIKFPALSITIVHRSDGSGSTNVVTSYLSDISSDWKAKVGKGNSVNWPIGVGSRGNEGVSEVIKQTHGAIGYLELAFAKQNKLTYADLKNKSGIYITATLAAIEAAEHIKMPADSKISIANTDAVGGYPLSGFSWALIYKEQNYNNRTEDKAKKVVNLLWWEIHEGQQFSKELSYGTLSNETVAIAEKILKQATYNGKILLNN